MRQIPCMCDADMISGPRSIRRSSLIRTDARFRKLCPPSSRALAQFSHLQNASGYAFAADVPKNVTRIIDRLTPCITKRRFSRQVSNQQLSAVLFFPHEHPAVFSFLYRSHPGLHPVSLNYLKRFSKDSDIHLYRMF